MLKQFHNVKIIKYFIIILIQIFIVTSIDLFALAPKNTSEKIENIVNLIKTKQLIELKNPKEIFEKLPTDINNEILNYLPQEQIKKISIFKMMTDSKKISNAKLFYLLNNQKIFPIIEWCKQAKFPLINILVEREKKFFKNLFENRILNMAMLKEFVKHKELGGFEALELAIKNKNFFVIDKLLEANISLDKGIIEELQTLQNPVLEKYKNKLENAYNFLNLEFLNNYDIKQYEKDLVKLYEKNPFNLNLCIEKNIEHHIYKDNLILFLIEADCFELAYTILEKNKNNVLDLDVKDIDNNTIFTLLINKTYKIFKENETIIKNILILLNKNHCLNIKNIADKNITNYKILLDVIDIIKLNDIDNSDEFVNTGKIKDICEKIDKLKNNSILVQNKLEEFKKIIKFLSIKSDIDLLSLTFNYFYNNFKPEYTEIIAQDLIKKILLALNIDINKEDENGKIFLTHLFSNNIYVNKILIKKIIDTYLKEIDINVPDKNGKTLLIHLCEKENFHNIEFLFNNYKEKIKINYQDHAGRTALMIACKNFKIDIINFLIDHGADKKILDNKGLKAIDYITYTDNEIIHSLSINIFDIINSHYRISSLDFIFSLLIILGEGVLNLLMLGILVLLALSLAVGLALAILILVIAGLVGIIILGAVLGVKKVVKILIKIEKEIGIETGEGIEEKILIMLSVLLIGGFVGALAIILLVVYGLLGLLALGILGVIVEVLLAIVLGILLSLVVVVLLLLLGIGILGVVIFRLVQIVKEINDSNFIQDVFNFYHINNKLLKCLLSILIFLNGIFFFPLFLISILILSIKTILTKRNINHPKIIKKSYIETVIDELKIEDIKKYIKENINNLEINKKIIENLNNYDDKIAQKEANQIKNITKKYINSINDNFEINEKKWFKLKLTKEKMLLILCVLKSIENINKNKFSSFVETHEFILSEMITKSININNVFDIKGLIENAA